MPCCPLSDLPFGLRFYWDLSSVTVLGVSLDSHSVSVSQSHYHMVSEGNDKPRCYFVVMASDLEWGLNRKGGLIFSNQGGRCEWKQVGRGQSKIGPPKCPNLLWNVSELSVSRNLEQNIE